MGNRRPAVALVAGAALVIAGCASRQQPEAARAVDEPGLVHVHGLAEDPADGSVFVATHTGLFDVDLSGAIRRVGDRYHDLMGFTVAGPGDFVASGHPDLQSPELMVDGKPPLLGLVSSTDGVEWEPQSLLGEVDFHSLEAAHGRIYGYDSTGGRFMVSDDRTSWREGAAVPLYDFAVSPADADVIVGLSDEGVLRSEDAGSTWTASDPGGYVVVDWGASGLIAIDPRGSVAVGDDGTDFKAVGSVQGQPEALLATQDRLLAAVADRGLLQSTDGGKTWTVLVETSEVGPPGGG